MSLPNHDHAFEATLAALQAATGRPWGDTDAPNGDRTVPDYPYGVGQLIPGGGTTGDVAQPDGMRTIVVQLTAVAPTEKGARSLAARAYQAMLGRGPTGFTMAIIPAEPTYVQNRAFDSAGGVDRSGPLYNAIDRYALTIASR